ncbi:probable 4-coumarate--CoA ligase 1 [Culicoides brevitarsis]|uniref:probable 4-coumarate--CoA ligase 1 n=1 Tax=Culicoides brevitarsis TaxID=469753 RepID=UPI00307B37E9
MSFYNPETKIWSSDDRPSIYNPKASLGEVLLHSLRRTPNKICEISDDFEVTLTCADIMKRSIQVAESLKTDYGLKFGDVCSIVAKNNPEVSSVAFGCIFNGCPVNAMDPAFAQIDFDHMIELTKPKVVFVEMNVVEKIQISIEKLKLDTKIFCFTDIEGRTSAGITPVNNFFKKTLEFKIEDYLPARIDDTTKHTAVIICSSGTTGLSKGVCLSHAQVVSQTLRFWKVYEEDKIFAFSSLYWITGVTVLLMGTVEGAIRINTTKPFTPQNFFEIVQRNKVSVLFLPPSLAAMALESTEIDKADLSSIVRCYVGGSFVLEDLCVSFEKYLAKGAKVMSVYGMSEIGTGCTVNYARKSGSVGGLQCENKIKIISEDGKLLGPNEKGEICKSHPYPFLGYFGNEEATKELYDKDGWIRSGDLGYFDEEGFLYISGRKKELIKYKNYQISPETLETLIQEITGLSQVCAVAIEENRLGTDLPAAVIVLPKDFSMTQKEIIAILNEKLDEVKKLRGGVYFVEKFPMTPSGKIVRRIVKELANKLYSERNTQSG